MQGYHIDPILPAAVQHVLVRRHPPLAHVCGTKSCALGKLNTKLGLALIFIAAQTIRWLDELRIHPLQCLGRGVNESACLRLSLDRECR